MNIGIRDRIGSLWRDIRRWVAAVCVGFTLHWAAIDTHHVVEPLWRLQLPEIAPSAVASFYVLLFIAVAWWLYTLRRDFEPPRTRYLRVDTNPRQRQHLVLFLSVLNPQIFPDGIPGDISLTGDFAEDVALLDARQKAPKPKWAWEMALRGISHHVPCLQSVTIVCSRDSLRQLPQFLSLLGRYRALRDVNRRLLVNQAGKGRVIDCALLPTEVAAWDFEQFDVLSGGLADLLDYFRAERIPNRQVMVDLTGGQKVNSVVAAAITFNRHIKNQYVQTNEPWKVIGYDIVWEPREAEGIGV